ncbi:MAG: TM2 domain-containing protein [Clostridiales bacterium]|nr:TM2 domain-containing protein [Clostridiales bacterium]
MYCRRCGYYLDDSTAVCPRCGERREDRRFCAYCGKPLPEDAAFCPKCGAQVSDQPPYGEAPVYGTKSRIAAGLFGILLGAFGAHNFYLGYKSKAIAQLLITVLSFGILSFVSAIWGLVEGIIILSSKEYYDAEGYLLHD